MPAVKVVTVPAPITARTVAFDVLLRTHSGAWADEVLRPLAVGLHTKDAGLAHQLVFGCLRFQAQLDFLITHFAGKTIKLDPEVRIALRLGIFQLRYLDRIPDHAAVAETVELVKRARKRSATGLVNAVLRKVTREPIPFPDRPTALSTPAWLLDSWTQQHGADQAESIARTFLIQPEAHFQGDRQMDIGAQSIIPLLDLQSGMKMLDLCAAPGNKTIQALATGADVVACDRYLHRLKQVDCPKRVVLDATLVLPFHTLFDRILVDAPCSGTGTLGRNPEIKWRLKPSDIDDLAQRQQKILTNALALLKPGGRLVYATCSLQAKENEAVVEAVVTGRTEQSFYRIPGLAEGDGFYAAVITS